MLTKDRWKEYEEAVAHLARITFRKWMVGVEITDIMQEIWTEFFRICEQDTEIHKPLMLTRLRHFTSLYRDEESAYKFGKRQLKHEAMFGEGEKKTLDYWRTVKVLWETYVSRQTKRDAEVLRYAAIGMPNKQIAIIVSLSVKRVESLRSSLIRKFREEVENNVPTDSSK